jgi:energy-coupling factor transport system ATP-binding protein
MMDKLVEVSHLQFTYSDADKPVLSDVSFYLPRGQWTALIGPNGSGKSTITRLLDGFITPDNDKSTIVVGGVKLTPDTLWQVRDQIGIVFQNPDNQFVGATVEDDVAFGLENRQVPLPEMKKKVAWALDQVGMSAYKESEPQLLSGGQKQRVAMAGIIALRPQLIILDEATSMLDPAGRKQLLSLVRKLQKEEGLTVLAVTHDLNEANDADQVLVLNQGRIQAQDKPAAIFADPDQITRLGLELPFVYQVKAALAEQGINIEREIASEEELVSELCRLNSKM